VQKSCLFNKINQIFSLGNLLFGVEVYDFAELTEMKLLNHGKEIMKQIEP
jgi:hypothetical protein